MLRGMYGAAAGMIAQQQRQEMLTNNLANVQTAGFKADQATIRSFPNMMLKAMNTGEGPVKQNPTIGSIATGVYMQEQVPNFKQGDLNQTGNPTDLALRRIRAKVGLDAEKWRSSNTRCGKGL